VASTESPFASSLAADLVVLPVRDSRALTSASLRSMPSARPAEGPGFLAQLGDW
jgi:hypothetical protein